MREGGVRSREKTIKKFFALQVISKEISFPVKPPVKKLRHKLLVLPLRAISCGIAALHAFLFPGNSFPLCNYALYPSVTPINLSPR